jgi:hypothetical protein
MTTNQKNQDSRMDQDQNGRKDNQDNRRSGQENQGNSNESRGRSQESQENSGGNTSGRGFASMDEAKQREIASKGGKAAHDADRKGGQH